ncbi:phosphatidate cytidylyltransferase [Desulfuromonas acetoxidans]|uniref:phosphatidate cytidylyltransferase n=1 Tax=Desulfuromonas acetoxidans TaxID=891 RepID=UPI0013893D6B|nr:phosphatidate cytidylyltransferase [Desulfuromonas acetoxidans]NVD23640.1 phosphatidate cytidylyltransferase [Desulfuromonas acetoxidans]NVE15975.1 phosphatidate cytidylyltransferase [Desulfuromonas acetoxidans]
MPVVLLLIFACDTVWFTLALCGVCGIALWEFYRMVLDDSRFIEQVVATTGGIVFLAVSSYWPNHGQHVLAVFFMVFSLIFLARYQDLFRVVLELGLIVVGWLYIPLLISYFAALHDLEHGHLWVLLVLMMTMVCDSCAYFVGTAVGRHRLYPQISPKKSIEGALGGFVGSILSAMVVIPWLIPDTSVASAVVVGAVVGVFGQLGDLFESMVKRSAEVKDSGTLFPGHGGMLDRLDSLLFAFPCVYFCLLW